MYFWCQKHEYMSPHFYTTLTRVLHDLKYSRKTRPFLDILLLVLSIVKVNKLNYNVQKRRKTCLTLLSKKAKQSWSILARKIHVKTRNKINTSLSVISSKSILQTEYKLKTQWFSSTTPRNMKHGLVKFFKKLLVYFWCQKHEHVSPHFYTTLTRVLPHPMFIG